MTALDDAQAADALAGRFLVEFPREAARQLELVPERDAARSLAELSGEALMPVWDALAPGVAAMVFPHLPERQRRAILAGWDRNRSAALLGLLDDNERDRQLAAMDDGASNEIRQLMTYPENSAGRLMDTRAFVLHGHVSVAQALEMLRQRRTRKTIFVKLVDEEGRLSGLVDVRELAFSEPDVAIERLAVPVPAIVHPTDPREDVVEKFEALDLGELPVVDLDGRVLGLIRHDQLVDALKDQASVDMQTMVGASKDERALSSSWFAVRRRMPWLQVNLLTAFLAAAVVGLFEDTIARITALAVLLPVVAGQSGNAGAQALAVTMRGLALREIHVGHWFRVVRKEVNAGFWNGIAIAITCAIGVYVWSGNVGLVGVIAVSMVMSMVAAGIAGAAVPIVLSRLGQDPAVASSIILTTVTDVAGFFSFLGIATLLMAMLI